MTGKVTAQFLLAKAWLAISALPFRGGKEQLRTLGCYEHEAEVWPKIILTGPPIYI